MVGTTENVRQLNDGIIMLKVDPDEETTDLNVLLNPPVCLNGDPCNLDDCLVWADLRLPEPPKPAMEQLAKEQKGQPTKEGIDCMRVAAHVLAMVHARSGAQDRLRDSLDIGPGDGKLPTPLLEFFNSRLEEIAVTTSQLNGKVMWTLADMEQIPADLDLEVLRPADRSDVDGLERMLRIQYAMVEHPKAKRGRQHVEELLDKLDLIIDELQHHLFLLRKRHSSKGGSPHRPLLVWAAHFAVQISKRLGLRNEAGYRLMARTAEALGFQLATSEDEDISDEERFHREVVALRQKYRRMKKNSPEGHN